MATITNPYTVKVKKTSIPDSRSRFAEDQLYEYNGELFHETYERPTIEKSYSDKIHEVTMGEEKNLPLISYNYYGSVRLWWLIAEANDISDPFDVHAGDILVIPNLIQFYQTRLSKK